MREKEKRGFHNKKGFTLAETLLAVLILLMVSTIVATGIPVAKNAYEKVIISSNAEVLLSSAVSTLRNELGTAKDVDIPNAATNGNVLTGVKITYYNPKREARSKIYRAEDGIAMLERYDSESGLYSSAGRPGPVRLVSREAATENLYVTFSDVKYNKSTGVITFENVGVSRQGGGTNLTKRDKVSIRLISFEESH